MTKAHSSWSTRLSRMGFAKRVALLVGVLLIGFVIVSPFAYHVSESPGVIAAAASMGICLLAGLLAMLVSRSLCDSELVFYGVLLGMGFRLGVPLALLIVIYLHGGILAEAGLVYYLMIFYPVMLVVETALSLPEFNAVTD